MDRPIHVVITGHVDHGKSTVIGRLLYDTHSLPEDVERELSQRGGSNDTRGFAYVLDYLAEERKHNITIDTTQLPFHTVIRSYVIIDVPGHKEFTHHMVTGSAGADLAVVVVSANEGIQEQTMRHVNLLALLGVKDVIAVINKMDTVVYSEKIYAFLSHKMKDIVAGFGGRVIGSIPIMATRGENLAAPSSHMPWYEGKTFLETLDGYRKKDSLPEQAVFLVQDVYGDTAVGMIASGAIRAGDQLCAARTGKPHRVMALKKWPTTPDIFEAGESVGIMCDDADSVRRGAVLASPDAHTRKTHAIEVVIIWLAKEPLLKTDTLRIQCAAQDLSCRIEAITRVTNSATLAPIRPLPNRVCHTEIAHVMLSIPRLLVYQPFHELPELGRFVLARDGVVVAGGIIP